MNNWIPAMKLAYHQALQSPDPSTQTGSVVLSAKGQVVGRGFNGYPRGVVQKDERLVRPLKYKVIEHAERNAVYDAGRSGNSLVGGTMVAVWAACPDCARAIIQAGITRLVTHSFYRKVDTGQSAESNRRNWDEEIDIAFIMLEEAGVEIEFVDFQLMDESDSPLLYNGEHVRF